MTDSVYVCAGCNQPIPGNEPAKVYSEPGGRAWFFHYGNDVCYPVWRRNRLLQEVKQLTDVIGDREQFDMAIEAQRLWNGG